MEFVDEPARRTPVVREADVVVVGGGPAGIGAALRAARAGADVIVIEKCGNLGGANVTGWCRVQRRGKHIAGEIWETLEARGYAARVLDLFPELLLNPLFHYNANPAVNIERDQPARGLYTFDASMAACVINEMMEEAGVKLALRSLFVGAQLEDGNIKAVFVENASGRQAIRGQVFTDTTGNADVVARVGAPYTKAGNEYGVPIGMGLMWKMTGVDYQRLFEYQKSDPRLCQLIDQARENGELPYYSPEKTDIGLRPQAADLQFSGHPHPEIAPTVNAHRGEVELWMPSMYDWALDGADSADHYAAFLAHSFNTSINLGEVAGIAAALSVENGVTPKELAYPVLQRELLRQGILAE